MPSKWDAIDCEQGSSTHSLLNTMQGCQQQVQAIQAAPNSDCNHCVQQLSCRHATTQQQRLEPR